MTTVKMRNDKTHKYSLKILGNYYADQSGTRPYDGEHFEARTYFKGQCILEYI